MAHAFGVQPGKSEDGYSTENSEEPKMLPLRFFPVQKGGQQALDFLHFCDQHRALGCPQKQSEQFSEAGSNRFPHVRALLSRPLRRLCLTRA